MRKSFLKKMMGVMWLMLFALPWFFGVLAQSDDVDFAIIPEAVNEKQISGDVAAVGNVHVVTNDKEKSVWDVYKRIGTKEKRNLGDRLASGILSWDTLLDYVVYLVKFLSQVGLLIGAAMIIYAGYMYATQIFGWDTSKGKTSIKYAIIWVIVISFSFAIIRIITNAFLE